MSSWQAEIDAALERLQERYPEDRDQLAAAVDLARACHEGQYRRSGEPFILHPLAVAEILAEQGLSADTVTAGILHDVIEDSDCEEQRIRDAFGSDVAAIVQGVTKMQRVAPRDSPQRKQLATLRKLIFAAADDARTLVVKLADRLHNMRTIASMPAHRQQAIAQETLEVYAPIAHRLGMGRIREELEDRCLQVLDPQAYQEACLVQRQYLEGAADLERMATALRDRLAAGGMEADISSRVKSVSSIAGKLRRRGADQPLQDVLGIRVIVDTVDSCYRALGHIHALWSPLPGAFDDYIAVPRANLYQSLHTTVIGEHGQPVEVQVRTHQQHKIAEYGIAAHWLYKETLKEGGPPGTRTFLAHLAEGQRDSDNLDEAFEQIKRSMFDHEVFTFTPRGDIRLLPVGACAVDFAYAVHTDLGHHCVGARINGVLCPVTRPLRNGDRVEIITSPDASPSRDWLASVVTPRARGRIRHFYQADEDRERVQRGLDALHSALRQVGLGPISSGDALAHALERIGFAPHEAALEAERDDSRLRMIVRRLSSSLAESDDPAAPAVALSTMRPLSELGITLDGLPDSRGRLARCCNPAPGDEIVARMSLHRAAIVHRSDCRNLSVRPDAQAARLWPARFEGELTQSFRIKLVITCTDRDRLVSDMTAVISSLGCELAEIHLVSDGQLGRGHVVCVVPSFEHAEQLRVSLGTLEGILKVERAGA